MASESALVLNGNLNADGTIRLDRPPDVPPGRVRITLQPLPASVPGAIRLPDAPWPDDAISAPCDLPFPGRTEPRPPAASARLASRTLTGTEEDLG